MGSSGRRGATYEDVLAAPEHVVAEIIQGALVTSPRPASRHARAASRLGAELDGPFDRGKGGPGGWLLLDEPELHLHGDVPVREGVAHAWLVDPIARTLEALRLEGGRWTLLGTFRDEAKVRVAPFEAFELELAGLWAR